MRLIYWETGDVARELKCSPQNVKRLADEEVLRVRAVTLRGTRLFDPGYVEDLLRRWREPQS